MLTGLLLPPALLLPSLLVAAAPSGAQADGGALSVSPVHPPAAAAPSIAGVLDPRARAEGPGITETDGGDPPLTTVIVVRHAERAPGDDDPHLSAAGAARARTLAWMLENAGITVIYSTPLNRTMETVGPLAERLGIEIRIVEARAGGSGNDDFTSLARRIVEEHRGEVVLIAGHSNTVSPIANAFGVGAVPPLTSEEYDHLFVATVSGVGKGRLLRLRFGDPNPPVGL